MAIKKEIQKRIIEKTNTSRATEEEFLSILKNVVPGTGFRAALDGALKVGKGALIVVENDRTSPIFDGGFRINTAFTPQKLIELTKMDGAIVLSRDMKKINYSNVLLIPDSFIKTHETGTRHKAAERTAIQAETLTVAISERRNDITLYYKDIRYPLLRTDELLRKANEQLQLLEKQRELFDKYNHKLIFQELTNFFNLKQAIGVIQKGKLIQKIGNELRKSIIELGKEGTLLRIRVKEIISGVEKETDLVIKDYAKLDLDKSQLILNNLNYDEILDEEVMCQILNYENPNVCGSIAGWHVLSKTSLANSEVESLIKEAGNLQNIMKSEMELYKKVFTEEKALALKEELGKMKIFFNS